MQSSQGLTALHVLCCSLLSWFRDYVRCCYHVYVGFTLMQGTTLNVTHPHPKDRPSSRAVSSIFEKKKEKKQKSKPCWRTFSYLSSETALAASNTQASTKPGMFMLVFQAHTQMCTYIHIPMQTKNSLPRNTAFPIQVHTSRNAHTEETEEEKPVFHTAVLFCLQEFLFQPQARGQSKETKGSWGGM